MIDIPGFEVERVLGRGGMATVYLATQVSLQRRVALKVLAPELCADAVFCARFLREGRIAASLRHRHIVPIHDVGSHAGVAYMALAYLPRGSLAGAAGTIAPAEVLRMAREVGAALDLAHRNGIVHRDVKPENILQDDDGAYVLSDFGIAQLADASQAMTREGSTVGTPAYMAPEQWRKGDVDGRADLYSLGVVIYQLLSGKVPYSGSDGWAIGMQHLQAPLPRLPADLAALQPLVDALLAKSPDERIATGAAVAAEADRLVPLVGGTPSAATAGEAVIPSVPAWRQQPERAADLFATSVEAQIAPRRRFPPMRWMFVAAGAIAVLAGLGWRGLAARDSVERLLGLKPATIATIAVLPCETYTASAEHREIGDALAEELIHRLGRLKALTVIARSSSFALRDAGLAPTALGARLGASHVLACTVRRTPDGVRIAAELVDAKSGAQRWSAEYDRASDEVSGVIDDLAVGISGKLLDNLAGPDRALLIRHGTEDLEAIRLVERGRALGRAATPAALAEGHALIEQAAVLDPRYAAAPVALAELVEVEMRLARHDVAWWRERAEPLVERALALDPDFAGAYLLRGRLRCAELDWPTCKSDVDRALALAPGDAQVRAGAAAYHGLLGSRDRAIEHATRRLQIEPESALAWDDLAMALVRGGRAREALDVADRAIGRFPAHWPAQRSRAIALETLGRCDDALDANDHAIALGAQREEIDAVAASAYVCAGRRERAVALLRALEEQRASGDPVADIGFAVANLALGQKAAALDALEAMAAARDARLLDVLESPRYGAKQLAAEPRMIALVERLRLPAGALGWKAGT